MADWVNQARDGEVFQIQNLATAEENDRICRGFLEDLRSNKVVRTLHLDYSPCFGSVKSSKVLGEVVGSSTTLQELSLSAVGMNGDGLEYIIKGLLSNRNSALAYLNLSLNTRLGTKGAKLVEELLLGNIPTLKCLAIFGTGFTPEDTAPVARALAKNPTLHELGCGGGYGIIHPDRDGPLSSILRALTPVEQASDQEGKSNSTLQILRITYEYERDIAENLGRMLSRNSSLQALALWNFQFNREEWAEVWKVLRHNKRLKLLDLSGCGKGLGDAFVDLMDLLEANGTITEIRMAETQLETTGQSVLVKQQLDRNKKLAEIHLEEFNEIMGRLQSKSWNWKDVSDSKAVANVGRELGKWAISASSAAVVTIDNIFMALDSLLEIMQKLRVHLQHQVAKSIFQDVVRKLTDQINPMFEDICKYILLEYCQMCNLTGDFQEFVECCKRGITLTEGSQKDFARFHFHYFLGLAYINLLDAPQAEKELRDARNSMPTDLDVSKKFKNILTTKTMVQKLGSLLEAAEGRLALQLSSSAGMSSKYGEEALDKLQNSLEGLTIICESQNATLVDKENWIEVALEVSQVMSYFSKGQSNALHVCEMALQHAKELQISPILVGRAAIQCGGLAATVGNYEEAERYIGEGLAELDKLQCDEPLLSANLYHVLGKLLQSRGGSHLPKAEEALRQAIKMLSEVLNKGTLTSEFRIQAFETHKQYFSSLQSCLYAIYMQTEENQRRRIAREALVVAEQGRCRDLMLNLRETSMSRIPDNKELVGDDNVGLMDWKKFDTDGEYAWSHLEKCIAICTDGIKERNPEVKRVTFVEYTLTNTQMLIWVLHSHGTEEPGGAQTPSTLPSMYSIDVKEAFQESVMEDYPDLKEDFERAFERIYEQQELQSKYDRRLLETQTLQAVKLFEFYIEKVLSDPEPQKRLLTQLYMLLIKPIDIADNLVDGEPLIFIPHEALSFVPYAALLPKGGKHLIENHPIGAAYSLRALGWATKQCAALNARRAMSDINRVLLVADPLPLGVDKDSLEDSIEEVTKIATMLSQYSPKLLVREDASLETVVSHMKTTSWYHIACHGEVTSQYPQGVLFLGKAGMDEDATRGSESSEPSEQHRLGFLTPEIIAKDLGSVTARAAVLSACKVGRGKKTGEGLLGLSRAFMQAGVPLIIAPLRTVGSRLCSAFMQHLYKKLVEGESVMFALRSTMVDVIKKRVKVVAAKHEEEDEDEDDDEEWQVWDWAAWLAVGFPGVCLTSLTTPNVNDLQQNEGRLVIPNEDRVPTGHAESLSENKNPSSHEKAFCSDSDLVQNGTRDHLLDKSNERSCLRIGARELTIILGDDTRYWDWVRCEDSIFKEVAHLKLVWWLEAKGKLLSSLYPGTYTLSWRLRYSSSFIHPRNRSLVDCYIDPMFSLEVTGNEPVITQWRITENDMSVLLHHCAGGQQLLEWRWDTSGWMEVDVGEFSVASKDSPVEVNFSMKETDNNKCKSGLYLDGIVIRPSSLTPKYQGASGLGDLQVSRKDVDRLDDNGVSVGSKSVLGADGGTANGEAILGKPAPPQEDHTRSQLEEARGEINALKGFNARLENASEASRRTCEQLRHEHRRTVAELERVRKEKTALEAEKVNFQEQVVKAQANVQDENVVVASVKAGPQQFTTDVVQLEKKIAQFEQTQASHDNEKTKLSEEIALCRAQDGIYNKILSAKDSRIGNLVGELAMLKAERSKHR